MKDFQYKKRKKRVLRLLYLVILLFGVHTTTFAQSEKITLDVKEVPIRKFFDKIEAQSEYRFTYRDRLINDEQRVTYSTSGETIESLLQKTLTPLGLQFQISKKDILITGKTSTQKEIKDKTISGTVTDSNGESLIGVSVVVKGSSIGVATDIDGKYSLEIPAEDAQLQFHYIGYLLQTIPVENQTVIDVTLKEDTQILEEVVVTALGIKREKRLLGYSFQELKTDALNQTGNASIAGALQGKIAGVQMNISPTGLNGSTKITIRGNSSLTDNNQPLWVVDGIPYGDNSDSSVSLYGGIDRGGAAIDINPEDIESISVLKGPNSAALYGSRAGNGVILITTKKGANKKGFGIDYNTTFTWTDVAETLDMQTTYGQGLNGRYEAGTPFSYGAKLDDSLLPAWWVNDNGATVPYSYQGNKLKDYFQTGFAQNHNLSIGNTTEDSHYRLSLGYLDSKGLFEGEKLEKFNIDLNSGKKFNKYLSMDSKISLSKTRADNRPYIGKYGEMFQLMYLPNNINLNDLKEQYTRSEADLSGKEYDLHQNWIGPTQDIMNPYWIHNRRTNMDERWRMFGYHSIKVDLTDWLYVTGKWSIDYYRTKIEETDRGLGGNVEDLIMNDVFTKSENNFMEMNSEFMIKGNNNIGEKIRFDYGIGGNSMNTKTEILAAAARNMANKNSWYLNNAGLNLVSGIPTYANQYLTQKRVNSVYGMFQIAYNDYLSLDITDRNDWSSTLTDDYNYPSFNLSFVGTEFFNKIDRHLPAWLTFAKLRASYAKAGKDTEAYSLRNYRKYDQNFTGSVYTVDNVFVDGLKPEMNASFETGIEMKFLQNRIGFDFTYYNSVTENQIMRIPNVSGTDWKERR
ncbi:MAG: SusC/RagA family TonB-linked outer membrane protein, partial [Tannerella sp.]|nr:SusC/RagA family TonB-linked outer membrane protein [Tannerella sp.]